MRPPAPPRFAAPPPQGPAPAGRTFNEKPPAAQNAEPVKEREDTVARHTTSQTIGRLDRRTLGGLGACAAIWLSLVSPPRAAPAASDTPLPAPSAPQAATTGSPEKAAPPAASPKPATAEGAAKRPATEPAKAATSSADKAKPAPKAARPLPARSAAARARQGAERAIRQAEDNLAVERRR